MQSCMLVASDIELLNVKKNNIISRCRSAKYLKYGNVFEEFIRNLHSSMVIKL